MTRHRKIIDASLRRHLSTVYRTERLAGAVGQLTRTALRYALAQIPDKLTAFNVRHVADLIRVIVDRLRQVASMLIAVRLKGLAEWGHLAMARVLTTGAKRELDKAEDENVEEGLLDYLRMIIQPPAQWFLKQIVGRAPDLLTRLIDPQAASDIVLQGVADGFDRRKIANSLSEVFGGFEASARRVARTEGLRVATQTQLSASEEIPELIRGYQILSVLDARVRPDHRARHGTIYHREPKGNQLGFDVMPQPPLDQPGNVLAHNCRCFLAPVFHMDEANAEDVRAMLSAD